MAYCKAGLVIVAGLVAVVLMPYCKAGLVLVILMAYCKAGLVLEVLMAYCMLDWFL